MPDFSYVPYTRSQPPYVFVPREDWTSRGPGSNTTPYSGAYSRITIHHSGHGLDAYYNFIGTPPDPARRNELIRNIQGWHMDGKGWGDISYNYLITPDGYVYEGRPLSLVPGHTKELNAGNIGICIVGDTTKDPQLLTDRVRQAIIELICELVFAHPVDPSLIYGHDHYVQKDCPGAGVNAILHGGVNTILGQVALCIQAEEERRGLPTYGGGYGGYGGYGGSGGYGGGYVTGGVEEESGFVIGIDPEPGGGGSDPEECTAPQTSGP